MKKFCFLIITIWVLFSLNENTLAQTYSGSVVFVQDGDSVTFRTSGGKYLKTRLIGIDAPETRQTYGLNCKQTMKNLTFGIPATAQVYGTDAYKRKLIVLSTADWLSINQRLIEIGCAWEYSAPIELRTGYQLKEQTARNNGVGLWADAAPVAPWAFRSNCP